ncbi:MAG: hypothetical protein HKN30_13285 [Sulfitobacter sp.]|nr:hypothetical protein [Sulfitobacter sp.]
MDQTPHMPTPDPVITLRSFGFWAVFTGALALIVVLVSITGPTFEPKPSAGTQIGEIAGEIKRAAWRSLLGLPQPAPEPPTRYAQFKQLLPLVGPIIGVVAILLSLVSGLLRENWRFGAYGFCLGAAAIVFQIAWWIAALVACVILLVNIIENIGDIFSF